MVSVLMCTYNRERLLKYAMDSVLNQTYQNLEFIIIDDGSTDGTEELIKSYRDERIRYFKMERNSYYCYAANFGLGKCQGKYIAFMNSDDIWNLDKLEKQVNFMEEHEEYGACFSFVTLIDDDGKDVTDKCTEMRDLFGKQFDTQKERFRYLFKYENCLSHPSAFVRKDLMDKIGGYNLMYCQMADCDLWLRMMLEKPIYVFREPLIQFRWHVKSEKQISYATPGNVIRTFNEQVLIQKHLMEKISDEKFMEFFGDQFKNKNSASKIELEFEKAFILAESIGNAPELKVLAIEKLEEVLRTPGALEVLREHFSMDIFDVYNWNKDHMYTSKWLSKEIEDLRLTANHQENLKNVLEIQKEELMKMIEEQERLISQYQNVIQEYENSTSWKVTKPLRNFMRMVKNIKK